ncbi:NUDIX hydrolase [Lentzea sp. NPDC055074]
MASRPPLLVNLTADLVIFTIRDARLHVLLVERGNEPYRGLPALPGGFLREGESIEQTARRELAEETGLGDDLHLELVGVYSAPGRDPRPVRVITTAFLAIAPDLPWPTAGSDASAAHWTPVDEAVAASLAFDHGEILRDALEQARTSLQHSTIAVEFCAPEFTIGELRDVYEAVWGHPVDRANFHRKVTQAEGFVEKTGEKRPSGAGRPSVLYRAGDATVLEPPMTRPVSTR